MGTGAGEEGAGAGGAGAGGAGADGAGAGGAGGAWELEGTTGGAAFMDEVDTSEGIAVGVWGGVGVSYGVVTSVELEGGASRVEDGAGAALGLGTTTAELLEEGATDSRVEDER